LGKVSFSHLIIYHPLYPYTQVLENMARKLSEEKKQEQREEGKIRIENPSKLRKGSSKRMQNTKKPKSKRKSSKITQSNPVKFC